MKETTAVGDSVWWASVMKLNAIPGHVEIRGRIREPHEVGINGRVWRAAVQWMEVTKEEEGCETNPAILLDKQEAVALMDSLWDCGVRPSGGPAEKERENPVLPKQVESTAVERHLVALRLLDYLNNNEGTR